MTAPAERILDCPIPRKCAFLNDRSIRYKGLHGGRGSAKSHTVARVLLTTAATIPWRVFCFREIQNSIAASVHKLLKDLIEEMNLGVYYNVQDQIIRGYNGTEFTFHGLKGNAAAIKSAEGADVGWVEEAQTVSQQSWDTLTPTIRKPGSQIIATWNDRYATDAIHQSLIVKPPPSCKVVMMNWRDNPWFPESLNVDRLHMLRTNPKKYRNIWEGDLLTAVEGAIFEKEVLAAIAEGRVRPLSIDLTRPVDTFWDLGFGDRNAIWLAQAVGGWYNFVHYIEGSGRTITSYLLELQQLAQAGGFVYGLDWVPHDALDTELHKNLTGDRTRSVEMIMRAAGRAVRLIPKMRVEDGINAARSIFPQSRFDVDRCFLGLQALQTYQWGPVSANGAEPRKPLHDAASHGADAYRGAGISIREPRAPKKPTAPPPREFSSWRS